MVQSLTETSRQNLLSTGITLTSKYWTYLSNNMSKLMVRLCLCIKLSMWQKILWYHSRVKTGNIVHNMGIKLWSKRFDVYIFWIFPLFYSYFSFKIRKMYTARCYLYGGSTETLVVYVFMLFYVKENLIFYKKNHSKF